MNEAELKEMKEDRLANTAIVAFLGSLLMGQAWEMWEGSEAHYGAAHVHGTRLLGVGDLNLHGRLFRLVAVSSYGVDGNATPALGTCCNPFGCTYHAPHRIGFLHLQLVIFNLGTPR